MVQEAAAGDGRFVATGGPYRQYERRVRSRPDGRIEETVEFTLAIPVWSFLFVWPFKLAFGRPLHRRSTSPWWAPPARIDPRASGVLGLLCTMAIVGGYLGTLITQTLTFATDEFGNESTTSQSSALATVRAGVLLAIVLAALADRAGRRRALTIAAVAGCLVTATGAFVPNLGWLVVSQTVARGFATALLLLIAIVSAEEMPAGARAYAYSLMTMTAALGAGMCLWALPLADLGERWWRALYVIPLLFLPLIAVVMRRLPESKRFAVEHVEAPLAGHGRRFWLLASAGALLAVFAAPVSQLQNEFLKDERGFSASRIALFTVATATPGVIGIVVGGRWADVHGRRLVAAIGITGGVVFTLAQFAADGWPMWAWSVAGSILAGLTVPALGVYRPELFPTSLRGRAGGVIEGVTVAGSAAGLLIVGALVDGGRSYASAFAMIAAAPLAIAVLVLVAFPETAQRELEELNPEDLAATP